MYCIPADRQRYLKQCVRLFGVVWTPQSRVTFIFCLKTPDFTSFRYGTRSGSWKLKLTRAQFSHGPFFFGWPLTFFYASPDRPLFIKAESDGPLTGNLNFRMVPFFSRIFFGPLTLFLQPPYRPSLFFSKLGPFAKYLESGYSYGSFMRVTAFFLTGGFFCGPS
jgi:hypothetical protein